MILHVDVQRDTAPDQWLAFVTKIVGFMSDEVIVSVADQPERMLAVIVGVGHAARMIERHGRLRDNKILIQDDRDSSSSQSEQFQLFQMLKGERKKMLGLGGDYTKYLKAVIGLIYYWRIEIGLASDVYCLNDDCRLRLEAYKQQCGACGLRHSENWRQIDDDHKRRNSRPQTAHKPFYRLI